MQNEKVNCNVKDMFSNVYEIVKKIILAEVIIVKSISRD